MYTFSERSGNKSFNKLFIIVYSMVMLLFYYGYVLLDRHRLIKSHYWLSKKSLTEQDFNAIEQFGNLVTTFETLFVFSFMIAGLLTHILFRKNTHTGTSFLLLNTALFAGITMINYVIFLATSLPIGNLMQPLDEVKLYLVVFFIVLWFRIKTNADYEIFTRMLPQSLIQ